MDGDAGGIALMHSSGQRFRQLTGTTDALTDKVGCRWRDSKHRGGLRQQQRVFKGLTFLMHRNIAMTTEAGEQLIEAVFAVKTQSLRCTGGQRQAGIGPAVWPGSVVSSNPDTENLPRPILASRPKPMWPMSSRHCRQSFWLKRSVSSNR